MRAFELTYARYDEHQRAMETYWSLRWLQQEAVKDINGAELRENLDRLEGLPQVLRVPLLPDTDIGTRVRLTVKAIDLLERALAGVIRDILTGNEVSLARV